MNDTVPTPIPCWCDPVTHEPAAYLVDDTPICASCAEGIARAVPLSADLVRKRVSE